MIHPLTDDTSAELGVILLVPLRKPIKGPFRDFPRIGSSSRNNSDTERKVEEEESDEEEVAMEGRKRKRRSKEKTIPCESMSKKKPMTAITARAPRGKCDSKL